MDLEDIRGIWTARRRRNIRPFLEYPGIQNASDLEWLSLSSDGLILNEAAILGQNSIQTVLFVARYLRRGERLRQSAASCMEPGTIVVSKRDAHNVVYSAGGLEYSGWDAWNAFALLGTAAGDAQGLGLRVSVGRRHFAPWLDVGVRSRALLMSATAWQKTTSIYPILREHVSTTPLEQDQILAWTGEDPREVMPIERWNSLAPHETGSSVAWWLLDQRSCPAIPPSPVASAWMNIIRRPFIPLDKERRRRELAHAYEELAIEIARWEAVTREEVEKLEHRNAELRTDST